MIDPRKNLLPLLAVIGLGYFSWHLGGDLGWDPFLRRPKPIAFDYRPISTREDPAQTPVDSASPIVVTLKSRTYSIQPVAKYSIAGRVVSEKRYSPGWDYGLAADLSPVDLAMTWGELADSQMDRFISYDHGERFYHYHFRRDTPVSAQYIIEHSSNNHLIPATPLIDRTIKTIRKNEVVQIDGFLVNVSAHDQKGNFRWNTSLTRSDTGGGSCELIYVTQVKIGSAVYR